MKEVFSYIAQNGNKIVVWKNELDEIALANKCILNQSDANKLNKIDSPKRRVEYLALRVLIQTIFDNDTQLYYHQTGQPFLNEVKHISISHSKNYIAIAFGEQPVGIDIELPQQKMIPLMRRILSEKENAHFGDIYDLELACKIWGTKESILKCIGDKKLDYRDSIDTTSINNGIALQKDTIYKVCFYNVEDMLLSYATPLDNHKVL